MASAPSARALIVDDEPLAVERMQILCARLPNLQLVGTATDGEAALRLIEALQPDIVFLDIAMPGMTGMAVAESLASLASRPAIIFVTAYDQFAVAAFDAQATDYLLKPVTPERLARAVDRAMAQHGVGPASTGAQPAATHHVQEFWVPNRGELIRIEAAMIDHVEAERDYMRLHVGDRSYLIHETIGALERQLDPERFLRLHRSTIVRRDAIRRLVHDGQGSWSAELEGGKSFRIGRTWLASVRAAIGR